MPRRHRDGDRRLVRRRWDSCRDPQRLTRAFAPPASSNRRRPRWHNGAQPKAANGPLADRVAGPQLAAVERGDFARALESLGQLVGGVAHDFLKSGRYVRCVSQTPAWAWAARLLPAFRAVPYHQAQGSGHRAWARDRLRNNYPGRRPRPHLLRTRGRHYRHGVATRYRSGQGCRDL